MESFRILNKLAPRLRHEQPVIFAVLTDPAPGEQRKRHLEDFKLSQVVHAQVPFDLTVRLEQRGRGGSHAVAEGMANRHEGGIGRGLGHLKAGERRGVKIT